MTAAEEAPHGTNRRYSHGGCRCQVCRSEHAARYRRYRRATVYGQGPMVAAGRVRRHVLGLRDAGMTLREVAEQSGVALGAVRSLVECRGDRPSKTIRRENADALMRVGGAGAGSQKVDATGTRRRLQGLMVAGWSQRELGLRLGVSHNPVSNLVRGQAMVQYRLAVAVRDLSWEWSDRQPPGSDGSRLRARRYAARRGWVTVAAWDAIDDPAAVPDLSLEAPESVSSQAARRSHCASLLAGGASVAEAAREAGVSERTAQRINAGSRPPTAEEAAA